MLKTSVIIFGLFLIAAGISGVLFTMSSIFFGFIAVGVFLVFYGKPLGIKEATTLPFYPTSSDTTTVSTKSRTSFCLKCGTLLDPEEKYCRNCGEKLVFEQPKDGNRSQQRD